MELKIKSRKFNKEFNFRMPSSGGYITVNGRQICHGGCYGGVTITADPFNFEEKCREWYRDHMKRYKEYYQSCI